MAYTYINNRQSVNGFVFTIDGHLVYSPMTSVIGGSAVIEEGIGTFRVNNPGFFYNTSRSPYVLDRTGSFIKIYDADTDQPIASAIILDPNLVVGPNTFLKFKVVKYEYLKTYLDLDPTVYNLELRLEDNFKFCSTIPDWIPVGAESRSRWMPILSKELDPSIGQELDLRGGLGSVDGISLPMVLDTRYQSDNRIQRMFAEQAMTYKYNNEPVGEVDVDNITEEFLTTSQTTVDVLDRGNPLSSIPDSASDYLTYYPFLTNEGFELALPEPWFIDTEALIASGYTELSTDFNGILNRFSVSRGIDNTPKTGHSKYTVIFNGIPFPIGQSCKFYEINNFLNPEFQSWLLTYRGIVENIPLSDGLAEFSIELSSLTFTARVNTGMSNQQSLIERRKDPVRNSDVKNFFNSFIVSQVNVQDTFQWIKIGAIALPLIKIQNLRYLDALDNPALAEEYLNNWGLLEEELDTKASITFSSGIDDVGYKVGFIDRYGDTRRVSQLFNSRDLVTYGPSNEYSVDVTNWFLIGNISSPSITPFDSPWGYYILDQLGDSQEHDNFNQLRNDFNLRLNRAGRLNDLAGDERKFIADYFSTEEPVLIHLFQKFCKGYSYSELEPPQQSFWYKGRDDAFTDTDAPNFSIEVSVIDVILQILTSTGSGSTEVNAGDYRMVAGTNGAWDLIPREMALGIPLEDIDLDSFLKVKNSRGGMNALTVTNIYMESGESDPQKFLDEQILKPFFLSIATDTRGKIILVDIADVVFGPETIAIQSDKFARKSGDRSRVTLTYQAQDLVDSFTYRWKEPSRSSWDDPYFNRSLTSSGIEASATQRISPSGDRIIPVKSKARIFPRIQSSPIEFELNYAPSRGVGLDLATSYDERVGKTALFYLSRFNRIVPRATFELLWDDLSPDIGDTISFNLDAIPDKLGLVGNTSKVIVGKVIDVKVDRKAKVANYTAILTDSTLIPSELYWNITAELIAPSGDSWQVSDNLFCSGTNPLEDNSGNQVFEFDYSQFLVGSKVIVWDKNWRYIADTEIVAIDDNLIEFLDDSSFQADYRITLATIDDTQSLYKEFLTWFEEGQVYL